MYRIICEVCGTIIIGRRQKYCSKNCKYTHQKWNRKGENNPFYGKKHTDATRELMSKNHADFSRENHPNYGKVMSDEQKAKISRTKTGVPRSKESIDKQSATMKSYINNYVYDPNASQPEYRRKAIEAYGYECSVCGSTEGCLAVHHINGDHYDDDIANLVVLCRSCHHKAHQDHESGQHSSSINEEFKQVILESR